MDIKNHINGIENFWNQAKRHLRKFNGIPIILGVKALYNFAKKMNSECIILHAPLVVKNTIEKASNVDIAFVGIGCSKLECNSLYKTGYIDKKNQINLRISLVT